MSFFRKENYLLLGGAGMVGQQVAREIARSDLDPHQIIICGLTQEEVGEAVRNLHAEFREVNFIEVVGDIFVRREWNPLGTLQPLNRTQLLNSETHRAALYEDLYRKFEEAYPRSELVRLIEDFEPNVIVDCINTATAFSYENIYEASDLAKEEFDKLKSHVLSGAPELDRETLNKLVDAAGEAFEKLLILPSIPQLVRHIRLINDAMRVAKTRLYLKIGTTGTGGMGLNIPYTHSEESPSATLMEKTAVAFAHTGLMYLMARTLGGPAVKEFKPAAMIGYSDIAYRQLKVKRKGKVGTPGKVMKVYASKTVQLSTNGRLRLRPDQKGAVGYQSKGELKMAVVNTGENGLFAKGEFQAITAMRQMEFITPEEIARQVMLEINGSNTGYDMIGAIDGASMNPTYRAGYLRHFAIDELDKLEKERKLPSVALGDLGPPQLGKLLWEAHLLHVVYEKKKKGENELDKVLAKSKEELALEVYKWLKRDDRLRNTIVSVGLPILTGDSKSLTLIRGPYIRIPEKAEDISDYELKEIDAWARRGWVDLRPENMEIWQKRFAEMKDATTDLLRDRGSAAFTRGAYLADEISIGVVVAWIFNNELDDDGKIKFGYRIK